MRPLGRPLGNVEVEHSVPAWRSFREGGGFRKSCVQLFMAARYICASCYESGAVLRRRYLCFARRLMHNINLVLFVKRRSEQRVREEPGSGVFKDMWRHKAAIIRYSL